MHFSLYDQATGRFHMFENATGKYEVGGSENGVGMTLNDQWSNWWRVGMRPPPGQKLAPGFYPEAGCRYGRIAYLTLTNNNPPCMYHSPGQFGSFTIRQIEFNPAGSLTALEAVFKVSGGSHEAPGTVGTIRYNAYPLYFKQKAAKESRWGKVDETFHGDSTIFALAGDRRSIRFEAAVPRDIWAFALKAPKGKVFKVGRYKTAERPTESKAGMDILWFVDAQRDQPWTRCDLEASGQKAKAGPGTLNIRAIRYDPAGKVAGMLADYEFHCVDANGRMELPIRGKFRINI